MALRGSAEAPPLDPALVPGAMAQTKRRELPDGSLIDFEYAPAGWLTKDGIPRAKEWRAYYVTTPDADCAFCHGTGRVEGKGARTRQCAICKGSGNASTRTRLPSVTTILDAICPKPGLPPWAEARGIEGAHEAWRLGELHHDTAPSEAVATVRRLRLGADRARDDAAQRGLDVHAVLERYMLTGAPPNPAEHPVEHHGYLRALTRWLLATDPQPEAVEQLVASPQDGYAGRLDLEALCGGRRIRYDAKTQENGAIYEAAHAQLGLYERAAQACGDEPADELRVVVFAADGAFREMPCAATPRTVDALLAYYREIRPIYSACESANRFEREARRA